ncbi:hypothetical protein AVEN_195933-1 [Araneus ventricosus]|uniref:Uncharacterized protein n=1 Tax=Araneus ventricosus TaxID=182803 RepID=A0A4Y2I828_ARAVE|nr:hypothetical protein AVEN_195933-1 [Araneus ventricosus]
MEKVGVLKYRSTCALAAPVPDSNFSLQQSCSNLALQICKLAANLTRQECKLEASYCKRGSHHKSNLPQACCVKLIANTEHSDKPRIRAPDKPLHSQTP